eukprot:4600270-Amphidinium_carterae.1
MRAHGWSASIMWAWDRERCTQVISEPQPKVVRQQWQRGNTIWAVDTIGVQRGKHALNNCLSAEAAKG